MELEPATRAADFAPARASTAPIVGAGHRRRGASPCGARGAESARLAFFYGIGAQREMEELCARAIRQPIAMVSSQWLAGLNSRGACDPATGAETRGVRGSSGGPYRLTISLQDRDGGRTVIGIDREPMATISVQGADRSRQRRQTLRPRTTVQRAPQLVLRLGVATARERSAHFACVRRGCSTPIGGVPSARGGIFVLQSEMAASLVLANPGRRSWRLAQITSRFSQRLRGYRKAETVVDS